MAGPITNLTCSMQTVLQWVASFTDPLLGPFPNNGQVSSAITFQNLLGAAFPANQCKVFELVIPAGGSLTTDMTAPSINVLRDSTATLARVMAGLIWLPSNTMHTLGSLASGVTVGKSLTTPANMFGLFDSSSSIMLSNGDASAWISSQPGGYPLHSLQKNLLITNQDSTNVANVLVGLIGMDFSFPSLDFSNPNSGQYWPILL